ncbi:hypothetical protein COV18_07190 [Candidatus Woesearchaeota archaeon CG10_big_fil_rev_8_21_14_0_10_37_12]|nr:MAG: hypothetical protein COV18_07190 [Candidatus Woesearchaeota archaeon CG10_big_fil_rev_8_21_14_0_10_37_12]
MINFKQISLLFLVAVIAIVSSQVVFGQLLYANATQCGVVNDSQTITLTAGNISSGLVNGTCFYINGSNIIIDGDGLNLTGSGTVDLEGSGSAVMIASQGSWIDPASAGAIIINVTNVSVRNLNISNFTNAFNFSNASNVSISNVNISNIGRSAIVFVNVTSSNVSYVNANVSNTSANVLSFNTSSNDLNVSNNVFAIFNNSASQPSHVIFGVESNNSIIRTNNITSGNSTTQSIVAADGIRLINSSGGWIDNNSILLRGNASQGINLTRTNNTVVSNNTINTSGNFSAGVFLLTTISNTLVTNTLLTSGTFNASDVNAQSSTQLRLQNQTTGAYNFTSVGLIVENTAFGELSFLNTSITQNGTNLTPHLEITNNNVFVNSTPAPGFNTTANLTFYSTSSLGLDSTPAPFRDGQLCPGTICTVLQNANTFIFNVTNFSNYSIGGNCGFLNASYTLIQPITTVNGTCFYINASNIILDGAGLNVTGNGTSLQAGSAVQIVSQGAGLGGIFNFTNVTIRNLNVSNFTNALNFTNGTNISVSNLNVSTLGGSGIVFVNVSSSNVSYVNANVSNTSANVLSFNTSSNNLNISNNVFASLGAPGLVSSHVIFGVESNNSIIRTNNITTVLVNSPGNLVSLDGIRLENSSGGWIDNNSILLRSNASQGVNLTRTNNTVVSNNTINSTGTFSSSAGIFLLSTISNVLMNNVFVTNATFNASDVNAQSSTQLILRNQSDNVSIYNFTSVGLIVENTAFAQLSYLNASIVRNGTNLSNDVQIESNNVFVDSDDAVGLNQPANLTFFGATNFVTRTPFRNGASCASAICTVLQNSDTYIFNVTGFTNYSVGEGSGPAVGGTSSGGGGGGGGISSANQRKSWTSLGPQQQATFVLNEHKIAVSQILFKVRENVRAPWMSVTKREAAPFALNKIDPTYQLLEVTKSTDLVVSDVKIKFAVSKAWLSENNMNNDDVALFRHIDKKWVQLPTKIEQASIAEVQFSAESPGFSYFLIGKREDSKSQATNAITGNDVRESEKDVVELEEKPVKKVAESVVDREVDVQDDVLVEQVPAPSNTPLYVGIILVLLIVVIPAGIYWYKNHY